MLTMETKSQNPIANSLQPNAASNSKNPQDPGNETSVAYSMISRKYIVMFRYFRHFSKYLVSLEELIVPPMDLPFDDCFMLSL